MGKITKILPLLTILALLCPCAMAEDTSLYLACVKDKKQNIQGVVVSINIVPEIKFGGDLEEKEWVILETINGTKSAFVEDIETCSCSELEIDKYPEKDYIIMLLERGYQ